MVGKEAINCFAFIVIYLESVTNWSALCINSKHCSDWTQQKPRKCFSFILSMLLCAMTFARKKTRSIRWSISSTVWGSFWFTTEYIPSKSCYAPQQCCTQTDKVYECMADVKFSRNVIIINNRQKLKLNLALYSVVCYVVFVSICASLIALSLLRIVVSNFTIIVRPQVSSQQWVPHSGCWNVWALNTNNSSIWVLSPMCLKPVYIDTV